MRCRIGWSIIFSFFIFIFNWLMIALQYWFDFCHTSTWINHRYICPHPLESPSHLLPIHTPLGYYRAPVWVPWVKQQIPTYVNYIINTIYLHKLFTYLQYVSYLQRYLLKWVYMLPRYSLHSSHPVPPLPGPCTSVCSLCLHLHCCPISRFFSTIFLDSIYVCYYRIFVFMFLTYFTLYNML